ncbi:MAG: DUF1080 domain-containing protein [Rhodothermales bacterium]
MSHRIISIFLVLAFIAAGCGSGDEADMSASVDVPALTHPNTSAPEWQPLFDTNLSNAIDAAGVWSWEGDVLTATEDEAIFTQGSYDDYILDLEVRFEPGANSGIIVHTSDVEDWIPNSLEIQIGDSYAHPDSAETPTIHHAGAMYGHVAPSEQRINPPGEWNRYTVTAHGDSLWTIVNGALVSEIDMSEYTSAEVNPDGTEIPEWLSTPLAELPTEGQIGLQGKHGESGVFFRNVRIRPLD